MQKPSSSFKNVPYPLVLCVRSEGILCDVLRRICMSSNKLSKKKRSREKDPLTVYRGIKKKMRIERCLFEDIANLVHVRVRIGRA